MWEVIGAIVIGLFSLANLLVNARLNGKLNKVRDQVVNGHSTNLREESDERHLENATKLDRLLEVVDGLLEVVHRLEGSVTRLWEYRSSDSERIHDLELTQPNNRKKKS